ncbi:MAG: aminotransferase class V-fold PLP-dependent enzyme [Holophagales bacterium]|nr:aminotransferase class V-fold PLP-dependent enzyme [Holophagales bacterium]
MSIVPNTTYGLALVAQGLDWKPGDVVVTTESEFPANLTPWLDLGRLGVEVRRIPTRDGAFTAEEVFDLRRANAPRLALARRLPHRVRGARGRGGDVLPGERHRLRPRRDPGGRGDPGRRRRARCRLPLGRRPQVDARPRRVRALLHGPRVPLPAPPAFRLAQPEADPPDNVRARKRPRYVEDATKFEIGALPSRASTPSAPPSASSSRPGARRSARGSARSAPSSRRGSPASAGSRSSTGRRSLPASSPPGRRPVRTRVAR